jgi:hypothetical protein
LSYEFSALARDPNGDSVQLQFEWDDGDTSDWSRMVRESTVVTMPHAWDSSGEYSVVARARDRKGLISEWSNVHIMVAVEDTADLPPGIPLVPAGPDTGYVDSMYQFTTAGADPDGDSIMFQFDWGDGDTSEWSAMVPESTVVSMFHAWDSASEYPVRARAMDEKGLVGEWSNVHLLTICDSLRVQLRMVGEADPMPDSSGFRIYVVNDQPDSVTISWLHFYSMPESAYMRYFLIDANPGTGFPLGVADPGIGSGDTVRFAPLTIAPGGTQMVELLLQQFYPVSVPAPPHDTLANVCGREFQLRFSNGSDIEFVVPYP